LDVIQKAITKKEVRLPFGGLISRVSIMDKTSLHDSEPTIKIYEKISNVTVVKFKVVVSKKRSHPEESNSSQPDQPLNPSYN
jgi:hypothetical protein